MADDAAGDAERVRFILCQVVGQAGHRRVHLGAAELFVVGIFTRGHLHQRRAAEEDLGASANEDVVVGHAGLVGAAGCGAAEYDRDGGNPGGRERRDVVEEAPALCEVAELPAHLGLDRLLAPSQVSSGRLHELDVGQAVEARDLQGPVGLLHRDGRDGAAQHRRVVGGDDALHAGDGADAGDQPAADCVVGVVARQRAQLKER